MNLRVLVADDDRAIRESLATALELAGYTVTTSADGVQALAACRTEPFDLSVLDVMMPGVDGLGVCQVVRAEGLTTPILMLTTESAPELKARARNAGATGWIVKPFDPQKLVSSLHMVTG